MRQEKTSTAGARTQFIKLEQGYPTYSGGEINPAYSIVGGGIVGYCKWLKWNCAGELHDSFGGTREAAANLVFATKAVATAEVRPYTPGPWSVVSDDPWAIMEDATSDYVAEAFHNVEKSQENARLIAAAPELLEACRLLAPVAGKFSISQGEVFPVDDYNRRRKLIPSEVNDFINGVLKLLKALRKAEGTNL